MKTLMTLLLLVSFLQASQYHPGIKLPNPHDPMAIKYYKGELLYEGVYGYGNETFTFVVMLDKLNLDVVPYKFCGNQHDRFKDVDLGEMATVYYYIVQTRRGCYEFIGVTSRIAM